MSADYYERSQGLSKTVAAIATDAHFWVPTIVLLAGLALLRWIS